MLNNKKIFDVITPLHEFHRMSKPIANGGEYMDVDTVPGMWVKLTEDGVMSTRAAAGAGYSALCISNWKSEDGAGVYEAHDTRGGSITVVVQPGVVAKAGSFYFTDDISTYAIGDLLAVISAGGISHVQVGKMKKAVSGTDTANAVVIGLGDDYVEYMIITPKAA